MPLEHSFPSVARRVEMLNERVKGRGALATLRQALSDPWVGHTALVSSFGTESVVLLHMVSTLDRSLPILFVDTEMLFPETLAYQEELAERFRLTHVKRIQPDRGDLLEKDADGILHVFDPDACCALRKSAPLNGALEPFDAWITGRKRFQGGQRRELAAFEADEHGRIKVNPLAHWRREDLSEYMENNRLPKHPLIAKGFQSLGCMPCTTPVGSGEDPRAGRWRGRAKTECGIHFGNTPTSEGTST